VAGKCWPAVVYGMVWYDMVGKEVGKKVKKDPTSHRSFSIDRSVGRYIPILGERAKGQARERRIREGEKIKDERPGYSYSYIYLIIII